MNRVFISQRPRCPLGFPLDIRQRHPVPETGSGDKAQFNHYGINYARSSGGSAWRRNGYI
jgi:hypothetical protein